LEDARAPEARRALEDARAPEARRALLNTFPPASRLRPILVLRFRDQARFHDFPPAAWIEGLPLPRIQWVPGVLAVFALPTLHSFLHAAQRAEGQGKDALWLRVEFGAPSFVALLVVVE